MLTWGSLVFGIVVGWVTYRTLRRSAVTGLSDIAAVIGAIGGAAVTTLFQAASEAFGVYCVGLGIGFFGYLATAMIIASRSEGGLTPVAEWLGDTPVVTNGSATPAPGRAVPPMPRVD